MRLKTKNSKTKIISAMIDLVAGLSERYPKLGNIDYIIVSEDFKKELYKDFAQDINGYTHDKYLAICGVQVKSENEK